MIAEPPVPPPEASVLAAPTDESTSAAAPVIAEKADGSVVIDLTQLMPPPPSDCIAEEPDPFNPEIVVCKTTTPSPRLGPMVGPVDEGFGSAIPRARIKLSDTASAEANVAKSPVGGFDADGAEVRVKIDF
jgi:hypothetical protein